MLTMKNNVRFALYARLSREDESDNDESRSIENQHCLIYIRTIL